MPARRVLGQSSGSLLSVSDHHHEQCWSKRAVSLGTVCAPLCLYVLSLADCCTVSAEGRQTYISPHFLFDQPAEISSPVLKGGCSKTKLLALVIDTLG